MGALIIKFSREMMSVQDPNLKLYMFFIQEK